MYGVTKVLLLASFDDYSPLTIEAFIFPGITNTTVTLSINDDDKLESDELFDIFLIVPLNLTGLSILSGNDTTASLNVVDNDGKFNHFVI